MADYYWLHSSRIDRGHSRKSPQGTVWFPTHCRHFSRSEWLGAFPRRPFAYARGSTNEYTQPERARGAVSPTLLSLLERSDYCRLRPIPRAGTRFLALRCNDGRRTRYPHELRGRGALLLLVRRAYY